MKSLKSVLLFWGKFISKTHTPLFPLLPILGNRSGVSADSNIRPV